MSDAPTYVFVYGTLLRGQSAEGYLSGLRRWPATTHGRLYRAPAGYPALVHDPSGGAVQGEVIRLDSAGRLAVLDLYEGVPEGLYVRRRIPVQSMDRPGEAWAWVIDAATARVRRYVPLRTGDWRTVAPRA